MLRLIAAVICLGLGGPALADMPTDGPHIERDIPRTEGVQEDAADVWLRESDPRAAGRR